MVRTLLALALSAAPMLAAAATAVPATPSAGPASDTHARDGGIIEGRIIVIDLQRSAIDVDSPARGHVAMAVMPSTSIQTKDAGYHVLADLRVGDRVQVYCSVNAGLYTAQIIRIR
jgi:hypothetical protein